VAGKPPEESLLGSLLAGKGIPKNDSDAVENGGLGGFTGHTGPKISSMRFHTVQTVLAYAMCQLAGYLYKVRLLIPRSVRMRRGQSDCPPLAQRRPLQISKSDAGILQTSRLGVEWSPGCEPSAGIMP
jgi:hypothetical protein